MTANPDAQIQHLAKLPLPVNQHVRQQVALMADRAATTHRDLAHSIAMDPGYSLALLRALEGRPQHQRNALSGMPHLISMLGVDKVLETARGLPALHEQPEPVRTPLSRHYGQTALAVSLVRDWAETGQLADPEELALATNLHGLLPALKILSGDPAPIDDPHGSQALARALGLPELATESHSLSGAFERRPLAVMLAFALARTADDWYAEETHDLLELGAQFTHTDSDQFCARMHALAARTARETHTWELPNSLGHLLLPAPPPLPEQPTQTTANPSATGPITPQAAFGQVMRGMQRKAGLERVLFAMLTPDRNRLKARFVLGGESGDGLREFQLDLQPDSLFSLLLPKPSAIWFNADNRGKYQALIPDSLRAVLHPTDFFAMSLHLQGKPIGVFYADRRAGELGADHYRLFKRYCQQAVVALDKLQQA